MTHNSHADAPQAHPYRVEIQSLQAEIRAEEARDLAASERISAAQAAYDYAMADYDPTAPDHEVHLFDAMKAAVAVADRYRLSPTPEAGSDLAKLSAGAAKGEWLLDVQTYYDEDGGPSEDHTEGVMVLDNDDQPDSIVQCSEANAKFIAAIVNAYRAGRLVEASPSPPPAEDLAGQGEPVAWAYEYLGVIGDWVPFLSRRRPANADHIRNIRPLYAAPAPSRPADREEIALTYEGLAKRIHTAFPDLTANDALCAAEGMFPECLKDGGISLALRDAPRNGGDG